MGGKGSNERRGGGDKGEERGRKEKEKVFFMHYNVQCSSITMCNALVLQCLMH